MKFIIVHISKNRWVVAEEESDGSYKPITKPSSKILAKNAKHEIETLDHREYHADTVAILFD